MIDKYMTDEVTEKLDACNYFLVYSASRSALRISFARTNRRKKSLKIIDPYLWNDLPLDIHHPLLVSNTT